MGTLIFKTVKPGGARRDRTADLLHAMQALSQLSYGPTSRAGTLIKYCLSVNQFTVNSLNFE